MPASHDFHNARKTWSLIKHKILGGYLSLLLGKVARPGNSKQSPVYLYCVDGFAGQGRYGNNEKGSPLIAAELSENPVQPSRQGLLRCINVEAKQETFDNLQEFTKPYVDKGYTLNLFGSFEDHLEGILHRVGTNPAFFFIDPSGTAATDFSTLERISQRPSRKTEALVRYDDTRVKRLIAWSRNNIDRLDDRARRTAEQFARKVNDLTSDDAIQSFLNSEPNSRERLIEGYIAEVKRRNIFRYAIYYPVRNPQTGGHRYYLVHFCNFPDGYFYMADFMARAERSFLPQPIKHSYTSDQQGALFDDFRPSVKLQQGQIEILEIHDHLVKDAERARVDDIVKSLPKLLANAGYLGKRIENRQIYSLIVDQFKFTCTRKE